MTLIKFLIFSLIHFLIYRVKFLYLFISYLQFFFLNKKSKKNILNSLKIFKDSNKKNFRTIKNNKKKIIYNSLIPLTECNHVIQSSFILNCFYSLGCKPGFFKSYIYKNFFKKNGYEIFYPLEFYSNISNKKLSHIVNKIELTSLDNLINYTYKDIQCGKYALSSSMRYLRKSTIDFKNSKDKRCVNFFLKKSILLANASIFFLENEKNIDYALFNDRGYCGEGEFFDQCIIKNIKCIQFIASYKNNIFLLKKFNKNNKNDHPSAISDKLWNEYDKKEISDDQKSFLENEIYQMYNTNEWYPSAGTMVGKKILHKNELAKKIGNLDSEKKIAVIFPHIFWDGTFFYGDDLYNNYEEWYEETICYAVQNKNINWIIKAHPSNIVKNIQDNTYPKEERELTILKKIVGEIPDNIFYLPSNFKYSTYHLFDLLDYCITVRGTVGIEAAMRNKIVITAGTGRYDNKGFTDNIMNKEEYRKTLMNLHSFKSLNTNSKNKAIKFAYLSLICKNISFTGLNLKYQKNYQSQLISDVNKELLLGENSKKEIQNFVQWLENDDIDYFNDFIGFK